MGSKARSSNSSSSDNRTFDERMAADGQAIVARSGGDIIVTQTSEDAVALGSEFADAANEMAERAFTTSGNIALEGLHTARDGISASENALSEALNFTDRANADAYSFANDALYEGTGLVDSALDIARDASRDGIGASENALSEALQYADRLGADAFKFAGDASSGGIALARDASRDGYDFAEDLTQRGFDFGQSSLDEVVKVSGWAMDNSADTLDTALGFAEGARDDAYQFADRSLDTLSGAFLQTLEKSQEDSTQLSEKLIKLAIPALALIFIAQAMKG